MWRRRINKFFSLSAAERRLLFRTYVLVWGVRVGLWTAPFAVVRRVTNRLARPRHAEASTEASAEASPSSSSSPTIADVTDTIVLAVSRASRFVPYATCLTQALATRILLGRRGIPTVVRYGAARGPGGKFLAHAWVESAADGRVVIGGTTSPQRYAPFPAFDGGIHAGTTTGSGSAAPAAAVTSELVGLES
jgi:hypothetical protein